MPGSSFLAAMMMAAALNAPQRAVLAVADKLLDEGNVSYVYGGGRLGDPGTCEACNACLEAKHPAASQRLAVCKACRACSLDCSHFTELVFDEAGFPYPYLDTATMLSLTGDQLERRYGFVDLGTDLASAAPGDLLVYNGHVVILEKVRAPVAGQARYRGDVVHSTSGRAIRAPGEGIQRERFIDLATFRGPLRRILRHRSLVESGPAQPPVAAPSASPGPVAPAAAAPAHPLKPVSKHSPSDQSSL